MFWKSPFLGQKLTVLTLFLGQHEIKKKKELRYFCLIINPNFMQKKQKKLTKGSWENCVADKQTEWIHRTYMVNGCDIPSLYGYRTFIAPQLLLVHFLSFILIFLNGFLLVIRNPFPDLLVHPWGNIASLSWHLQSSHFVSIGSNVGIVSIDVKDNRSLFDKRNGGIIYGIFRFSWIWIVSCIFSGKSEMLFFFKFVEEEGPCLSLFSLLSLLGLIPSFSCLARIT